MKIREWYGFDGEYDGTLSINSCIDSLLDLYSKAIMQYFSAYHAKNFLDIQKVDPANLNSGQKLFLDWLKEKGFPYLQDLASKQLPDDEKLISQIEYDKYILEEEMDFEYPEDVRSTLISIVTDVPEYIQAAKEVSISIQFDEIYNNWCSWLTKPQVELEKKISQTTFFYEIKENEYQVSKYKEPLGSFLLFRKL